MRSQKDSAKVIENQEFEFLNSRIAWGAHHFFGNKKVQ